VSESSVSTASSSSSSSDSSDEEESLEVQIQQAERKNLEVEEEIKRTEEECERMERVRQELEREKREKEEHERLERERLAKEKEERLAKEKEERLTKEKEERFAKEKEERLAKEKEERLAKEKEERRKAKKEEKRRAKKEAKRLAKREANTAKKNTNLGNKRKREQSAQASVVPDSHTPPSKRKYVLPVPTMGKQLKPLPKNAHKLTIVSEDEDEEEDQMPVSRASSTTTTTQKPNLKASKHGAPRSDVDIPLSKALLKRLHLITEAEEEEEEDEDEEDKEEEEEDPQPVSRTSPTATTTRKTNLKTSKFDAPRSNVDIPLPGSKPLAEEGDDSDIEVISSTSHRNRSSLSIKKERKISETQLDEKGYYALSLPERNEMERNIRGMEQAATKLLEYCARQSALLGLTSGAIRARPVRNPEAPDDLEPVAPKPKMAKPRRPEGTVPQGTVDQQVELLAERNKMPKTEIKRMYWNGELMLWPQLGYVASMKAESPCAACLRKGRECVELDRGKEKCLFTHLCLSCVTESPRPTLPKCRG
jgi:hypothetical protein